MNKFYIILMSIILFVSSANSDDKLVKKSKIIPSTVNLSKHTIKYINFNQKGYYAVLIIEKQSNKKGKISEKSIKKR